MMALWRGFRNVYRNKSRAALVIIILGLTVGVFVIMVQVSGGIRENLNTVASQYLVLLEVRRAGATGMGVGVDALPEEFFDRAREIPNVVKVEKYLLQRMIYPERAASISVVVGMEPTASPRLALHGELSRPRLVEGRWLGPQDRGREVAVVGRFFAQWMGLGVGSRLTLRADKVALQDRPDPNVTLEDASFEVIGIFDSGFAFGDNQLFIPLDVAQRVFKQPNKVSHIYVTAASVERVEEIEEGLRTTFGDEADVISGQALAQAWGKTIGEMRSTSLLAAGISLGAAALVALFTMILVTRERAREIGILKAIGASNGHVISIFAAEATSLAIIGGLAGLAIYIAGGPILAAILTGATGSWAYSLREVAYGFVLAIGFSIIGSLYPVYRTVRMGPAEAMRP